MKFHALKDYQNHISSLFGILIGHCRLNVVPDGKIQKLNNLRKKSARATIALPGLSEMWCAVSFCCALLD